MEETPCSVVCKEGKDQRCLYLFILLMSLVTVLLLFFTNCMKGVRGREVKSKKDEEHIFREKETVKKRKTESDDFW